MIIPPQVNPARIAWDLRKAKPGRYEAYWRERPPVLSPALFESSKPVWLEIGAGSGWFFVEMARLHGDKQLIAIERSKTRGVRLVRKAAKSGLDNLAAFRGNAIPALIHGIPDRSVDRVYILYPCPWQRNSQRKNRWYLHPIMRHLVRILRPKGTLVWASDQKFYIDEARLVCERHHGMKVHEHGPIEPNPYNSLDLFPGGRTKFERTFLAAGQPCYELVAERGEEIRPLMPLMQ